MLKKYLGRIHFTSKWGGGAYVVSFPGNTTFRSLEFCYFVLWNDYIQTEYIRNLFCTYAIIVRERKILLRSHKIIIFVTLSTVAP